MQTLFTKWMGFSYSIFLNENNQLFKDSDFFKVLRLPVSPILKIKKISLGMLILRQKSFQFYIPRLKTPQPVLPYCKATHNRGTNFGRPFEWIGCKRCCFWPPWLYYKSTTVSGQSGCTYSIYNICKTGIIHHFPPISISRTKWAFFVMSMSTYDRMGFF